MTRLIDADALKKCAIPCEIHNGALTDLCVPLYQIDNAPTVERPQGEWIPVSERLPEEKINPYTTDFDEVLCTTICGAVRAYKFGKPKGHDKPHFWLCGTIMDELVIAWQPLPEPYKKGGAE